MIKLTQPSGVGQLFAVRAGMMGDHVAGDACALSVPPIAIRPATDGPAQHRRELISARLVTMKPAVSASVAPHAVKIQTPIGERANEQPSITREDLIPVHPEDLRYFQELFESPDAFLPEHRRLAVSVIDDMLQGTYNNGVLRADGTDTGDGSDQQVKANLNRNVLSALQTVFLSDEIIDAVLVSLGIPELLDGQPSANTGCILNGPPGTGKTILLRAVADIYEKMGCFVAEINFADISDRFVGSLAKNLDEKISSVLEQARKHNRPAYIFFDEATLAVKRIVDGDSCENYYQGALDVLKKYIGNYPELIFAISTNGKREDFDEALIRDGRLNVHSIDFPGMREKVKMWEHFLKKYDVIDALQPKQYQELALAFPERSQGAAIVKFVQNLLMQVTQNRLKGQGYHNIKEALLAGISLTRMKQEVRRTITYDEILEMARSYRVSVPEEGPKRKVVGFVTQKQG
ncbi:MAG: ATP-binding protein [Deltaproteobacteria bacterium]|nr:ATP-binding protein [Deltaproteobacteria bacterium]